MTERYYDGENNRFYTRPTPPMIYLKEDDEMDRRLVDKAYDWILITVCGCVGWLIFLGTAWITRDVFRSLLN